MTPYACNCPQPLGWGQHSAFPQGTGAAFAQREYCCAHISICLPRVTQVIRDTSAAWLWAEGFQEMHRTAFYSFTNLKSPFPSFSQNVLILLNFTPAFFFSFEMPIYNMTTSTGQYPSKCQLNPGCEAEGRSHRDHLLFEQRFSDPTSSCWGKERNHLPRHGWVKQPLYSRRAAAKPKAAKGGVEQLSQDAAVIPWGSLPPAQSPSPAWVPTWPSGTRTVVRQHSSFSPDSLQLCHSCPWLQHSPLPLSGQISSVGLCGLRAGHQGWLPAPCESWEQVWGSTSSSSPQEMRTCRMEEMPWLHLVVDFLTLS